MNVIDENKMKMDGLLLVDKPSGMTSHDVVSNVRKILNTREVGHSGTLDPLASGLMVLLVGEGTKLSSYITDGDKSYEVKCKLGLTTDTLDSTGTILSENPIICTKKQAIDQALAIQGEIELLIPMYSAKKIDGKKMYEYARSEQVIEQPKKVMKFWNLQSQNSQELENEIVHPDLELSFSVSCTKGSFIRSWVELLGKKLGCGATMTGLRRTRTSHFEISSAKTLNELKNGTPLAMVKMVDTLPGIKKIKVKDFELNLLKNGQIGQGLRAQLIRIFDPVNDQILQVHSERPERLVSLIGLDPLKGFVIRRVFNSIS